MKEILNFYCEGKSFTKLLYDMWASEEVAVVLDILENDGNLPKDIIMKFLRGKLRFDGNTKNANHELFLIENEHDDNYVAPPKLSIHRLVRVLERNFITLQLQIQKRINEKYFSDMTKFNPLNSSMENIEDDCVLNSLAQRQKKITKNLSKLYEFIGQDPYDFPVMRFLPVLSDYELDKLAKFQYIKRKINDSARAKLIQYDLLKDISDTKVTIDSEQTPFVYQKHNSITSSNGWLSPNGDFIPCEYSQHSMLSKIIVNKYSLKPGKDDEQILENHNWVKLSNGKFYLGTRDKLSQRQLDLIFDYMLKSNMKTIYIDYSVVSISELTKFV